MLPSLLADLRIKIFLLVLLLMFIHKFVHTQWTHDAYINDFRVNDDTTTRIQASSRLGVDTAGNFVIAWADYRNAPGTNMPQVYAQIFNKDGSRIGNNFRIGQDTTLLYDINVLNDGRFLAIWMWVHGLSGNYDLFIQRFTKQGNPISAATRIFDTTYSNQSVLFDLSIDSDTSGKYIICWTRNTGVNNGGVFFQRYDTNGIKIGNIGMVNEVTKRVLHPRIFVNDDGSFIISWEDIRNNPNDLKADIFMQRYNSLGIKIGNNVKVNDDTDTTKDQTQPVISGNGTGKFVICWTDKRISSSQPKIMYQLYDNNGNPVGPNKIASEGTSNLVAFPEISMRQDCYFFIGWTNYGANERYYGRRFDSLGNAYGSPSNSYIIPTGYPPSSNQGGPDVYVLNDRVYSIWGDNRLDIGDVFCNVRGFQNPDTVLSINGYIKEIPNKSELVGNYPNPFNANTIIKYNVFNTSLVTINIYNILGKLVETVVKSIQVPGQYKFNWNALNYSSGIYFVEMITNSGSRSLIKIILLK